MLVPKPYVIWVLRVGWRMDVVVSALILKWNFMGSNSGPASCLLCTRIISPPCASLSRSVKEGITMSSTYMFLMRIKWNTACEVLREMGGTQQVLSKCWICCDFVTGCWVAYVSCSELSWGAENGGESPPLWMDTVAMCIISCDKTPLECWFSKSVVTNYRKLHDLQQHRCIILTVWGAVRTRLKWVSMRQNQYVKGLVPSWNLGENLFSCLFRRPDLTRSPWLVATSSAFKPLRTSPVLLSLCPSDLFCLPFIRRLVTAIRDHQVT